MVWRLLEPYVAEAYHMSIARAVRSMVRKHDGSPRGAVEACVVERDVAGRRKFALASAGQGAFGKVYRLDRNRAAKLVRIEGSGFEREAELTRLASEIGVGPKVYDVFSCCGSENGVCYAIIIMDALDMTLTDWLRSPAAFTLAARERMRDAVDAKLRKMHRAGLFHNDLHTDNVMVTKDGVPFIIDFGLAREGAEESHNDRHVLREIVGDEARRWRSFLGPAASYPSSGGPGGSGSLSPDSRAERDAEKLRVLLSYVVRKLSPRVVGVGSGSS